VGIGRLPCAVLGTRGARQFFKINLTAFPDLHLDIQQMLAAGDSQVVVRWRSRGTHLGPLGDIPATGRKASNHGCTVMKGKNSKGGTPGSISTTHTCSGRSVFCQGADAEIS
jgi:SnoaL-like polyketide cyclase